MAVLGEPSGRMRWIGLNKKRDSLTTQLTLRGNEEDKEMETKLVVSLRSGMSRRVYCYFVAGSNSSLFVLEAWTRASKRNFVTLLDLDF